MFYSLLKNPIPRRTPENQTFEGVGMVKSNLCFQGEHPRGPPGVKLHDTNSIACVSRHPTARWPPWCKVTRHRQYNLCISTPDSAMATSGMTSGMTLGLRGHTAVLGDNLNFCQGRKIRKQSYVLGSARLIWLLNQFVLNSNCVARGTQACRDDFGDIRLLT